MKGLLIDGVHHIVPGCNIIAPGEEPWVYLNKRDCQDRINKPQQAILHKTIADDPEDILPGAGPSKACGGAQYTAEYWAGDPTPGGAHLITGFDGTSACLADISKVEAYHGNQANHLSYGHEMKELVGGGIYQATLDAAVRITLYATSALGIQWQCPSRYVNDVVLKRFVDGGTTLIGIFGHRDITTRRNKYDPGERVFEMLRAAGVESFDFQAGQDRDVWSVRQEWLREEGYYKGQIDGIPGPRTTAALKAIGYPDGIYARAKELPERPPAPRF